MSYLAEFLAWVAIDTAIYLTVWRFIEWGQWLEGVEKEVDAISKRGDQIGERLHLLEQRMQRGRVQQWKDGSLNAR